MIHRAPFGSMERFIGLLIEHFAGDFPTWLAPEQARLLPVSDKFMDYANEVLAVLQGAGVRATIDAHPDKLGAKIRRAEVEKTTYALVIGGKDRDARTVSVRSRFSGDEGAVPLDTFIARLRDEIVTRKLMLRGKGR